MINAIGRAFFSSREDLRQVREKFAGGHGTSNYSAIPLTDVLLEAVYFPAGEEMLKANRSCHKYLKQK